MAGKWLSRLIPAHSSDKNKKNRRQGHSSSVVKAVEEKPPRAVSASSSTSNSAAARLEDTCHAHRLIRYEQDNTSQRCIYAGGEDQDVDMAAGVFIDRFHKDLELQRTPSEARYYDYLERST